ncbi:hypothetical protein BACFRA24663_17050 [Bacteroides fragilis]
MQNMTLFNFIHLMIILILLKDYDHYHLTIMEILGLTEIMVNSFSKHLLVKLYGFLSRKIHYYYFIDLVNYFVYCKINFYILYCYNKI